MGQLQLCCVGDGGAGGCSSPGGLPGKPEPPRTMRGVHLRLPQLLPPSDTPPQRTYGLGWAPTELLHGWGLAGDRGVPGGYRGPVAGAGGAAPPPAGWGGSGRGGSPGGGVGGGRHLRGGTRTGLTCGSAAAAPDSSGTAPAAAAMGRREGCPVLLCLLLILLQVSRGTRDPARGGGTLPGALPGPDSSLGAGGSPAVRAGSAVSTWLRRRDLRPGRAAGPRGGGTGAGTR